MQYICDQHEIELTTDEIRNRILNEKNIPITEQFINSIFNRLNFNHRVKNLENFQKAMIHKSYLEANIRDPKTIKLLKDISPIDPNNKSKCIPLQPESYERLEYLGDSIIRHAISKYLFLRCPTEKEGFLTTNRSKMENNNALSDLARKFGMQNYVVISRNIEIANGRATYVDITGDIFESFVGALNLELDENKTVEFIWAVIEKELDVPEIIRTRNNYKDQLMRVFHKIDDVKHDLKYIDNEMDTRDGKKRFKTVVKDKQTGKALGVGSGRSKKSSQQRAAKDALIKLGLFGNEKKENEDEDEYFDYVENLDEEIEIVRNINYESKNRKL